MAVSRCTEAEIVRLGVAECCDCSARRIDESRYVARSEDLPWEDLVCILFCNGAEVRVAEDWDALAGARPYILERREVEDVARSPSSLDRGYAILLLRARKKVYVAKL